MNIKVFGDATKIFSVILFIQNDTFEIMRKNIETLGNQKNLKLVVQPCPYEGIEFLYQMDLDFPHARVSEEKEIFWHAITLKRNTPPDILEKVSIHHHQFLVSILQNETKKVEKERKELESLIQRYS